MNEGAFLGVLSWVSPAAGIGAGPKKRWINSEVG